MRRHRCVMSLPFLERHTVPTLLASANGHIWDARVMAPCDLEQYATMMGMPPTLLNALRTAANTVTAAQIRGLLGFASMVH